MSVSREELAAFADGELSGARAAEVAAAVAADPSLAAEVHAHRALRQRLSEHFAPIVEAPLPKRLTESLRSSSVVDFTAAREKRRTPSFARWGWIAAPALAATLALAVLMPRGEDKGYARGELAEALERQLVATQPAAAPNRILLSFRDRSGTFCRAFAGEEQSGVACRDADGWRLVMVGAGAPAQPGEYSMAGNPAAEALERAQAMASGPALGAAEERTAREQGWR